MTSSTSAPQRAATSAPEHAMATVALAIVGIFVTYLPITSISGALATIGAATGASTSELQWVSDAYVIPMAAAVLSAGVFGDLYGRRLIFVIGMGLTVLGGLVAGIGGAVVGDADALVAIWTGQVIAGIGAGLLIPTTLALIAQAVPDFRARGKFIGLWSTGLMLGLALGPIISGAVLEFADWPWLYAAPTVLAVVAGIAALTLMPESEPVTGRHLDWPGQITATVAIAASIFGIIEGGAEGWTSWQAIGGLGLGALSLAAFLFVENRTAEPLMDLGLFRSSAFSAANFAGLIALFSVVGAMFLLSLFLGTFQQLDTLEIGVRLIFGTGIGALVGPLAAALIHRYAPMFVLSAGLVVSALGLFLLTMISLDSGLWDIGWRLAIFGLGNTMTLTAVTIAAINAAPMRQAGMAAATNTAIRQYGSALGPAILGVVFAHALAGGSKPEDAFAAAVLVNVALLLGAAVVCLLAARNPEQAHAG